MIRSGSEASVGGPGPVSPPRLARGVHVRILITRLRFPSDQTRAGRKSVPLPLVLILVVAFAGCKEAPAPPVPAVCEVSPDSIDFGAVLPPLSGTGTQTVIREFTLTNRVYTNSTGGNTPLEGWVGVDFSAPGRTPPTIDFQAGRSDSSFSIAPRSSTSWKISARLTASTSTGNYDGIIRLNGACRDIPFHIRVVARAEPPPVFAEAWWAINGHIYQDPQDVAVDGRGSVYVSDASTNRVYRYDVHGRTTRTYSIIGKLGNLFVPVGVAVDPDGNLFISDTGTEEIHGRVIMFTPDGQYAGRWGPNKSGVGLFDLPWLMAADAEHRLYVLDYNARHVVRLDVQAGPSSSADRIWGSRGDAPGQFLTPYGIAVGPTGNVYVTDFQRDAVLEYTADGAFLLSWGSAGKEPGDLDRPTGIAVDAGGDVYVVDQGNRRIEKFDANGGFLTLWGSPGGDEGQFVNPLGIAVDTDGSVYVVDNGNLRIQRFVPAR